MDDLPRSAKSIFAWVTGIVLLLGTLFACVKYMVHAETSELRADVGILKTNVATLRDDLHKLDGDLSKTNNKIDQLLNKALDKAFPGTKGVVPTRGTLESAERVIALARVLDLKLDHVVLARYGSSVARISEDPTVGNVAWSSLKQAVDYRSFLNKDFVPTPKDLTVWPDKRGFYRPSINLVGEIPNSEKKPAVNIFFAGGIVRSEDSARLELLSNPQKSGSEIGLYVVEGGHMAIGLDNANMKNVVIRNAEVVYNGGPVRLENVAFVNCTFVFTKNRPTINLGETILQANSINFSTVSPS